MSNASNAYGIRTLRREPDTVAIEHLAAADLVMLARRAGTAAQSMTLDEREQYAQRFEALIQELEVAVMLMRQGAPPDRDHIPPCIQPGTPDIDTSPAQQRRRIELLTDVNARLHE
jgi:hypothetical protein